MSVTTDCDWRTAPSMGEEARASAPEGVIAKSLANCLKRLTANVTAITPSGAVKSAFADFTIKDAKSGKPDFVRLLPHRGGGALVLPGALL